MKVVVAIDSFKGSLSTFQAGEAVEKGVKKVYPNAEVFIRPLADGGEGTVSAVISAVDGELCEVEVTGPLGKKVLAQYGVIPQTQTAVMEMASSSGITLISAKERNPLYATTYGVGEMINHAIDKGCRKFIVGIGGSATNDGGVGMLQALGFSFLNKEGKEVPFGALGVKEIASINLTGARKELKECSFMVACDVKNPLCGKDGCSHVFARQKGGTDEMILDMDEWLNAYADLSATVCKGADKNAHGAGAAGGLGFAFLAYLSATMRSGIELVMQETSLERYIEEADIVVTGEGRLDGQSVMGKAPVGVANLAKKHNKPVLAFSGCVTKDATLCNKHGINAFFPILQAPCSLEEAMNVENAFANLSATAQQAFRVVKTFQK